MKKIKEVDTYLRVKKLETDTYMATLTKDGKTVYNNTIYVVSFLGNDEVTARMSGEFIEDWDMKLEALKLIDMLRRKRNE